MDRIPKSHVGSSLNFTPKVLCIFMPLLIGKRILFPGKSLFNVTVPPSLRYCDCPERYMTETPTPKSTTETHSQEEIANKNIFPIP